MVQQPTFEPHAILVADMVGYSRWLATQPGATHAAFTNHLRYVFGPAVRAHAGRVVKTTGDGIVAIFHRPGDAEVSAREIQSRLEGAAVGISSGIDLTYRIAVHYGDIMVLPDDIYGIDVNAAIHMQTLAPPGGICISRQLFGHLDEESKASYRYAGSKYVKNIPDPFDIYLFHRDHGLLGKRLSSVQPPALHRRTLSPLPRVGIAELRAYAQHESQHVIVSFVHDALMEALSRFRDLLIVSPVDLEINRTSSHFGKLREHMSRDLALEYLIHGSCIVGCDELTLIIHLEYLPRQELMYSSKVAIDAKDLSKMGRQISSECVIPIILHLQRNEAEPWGAFRNSEDEQAFRKAQKLMPQRTLEALDQARRLLVGILERRGEIGNVYVALARAEHDHGQLLAGEQFVESLEKARAYAKKAVELDDLNPRAHGELAQQALFLRRHATAAEEYQRALRLNPYDPFLLADWADCLAYIGRADEALPILENLAVSWPRDKAWVEWNLCDAEWALNRPEKIIELLRDRPDLPHVNRYLAASYAKLGRMTEARHHAERVRAHQPNFSAKAWSRVPPYADRDAGEEYAHFLARAGL
jgi:adenylate cyclase